MPVDPANPNGVPPANTQPGQPTQQPAQVQPQQNGMLPPVNRSQAPVPPATTNANPNQPQTMNGDPANPQNPEEVTNEPDAKQKLNRKERKDFLVKEMRKRIDHYFEINVRQIGDLIPKIITNFLINEILVK